MGFLRKYFTIQPLGTPEASAAAYVPLVMVSRGLAFVRTLVVARLLGDLDFQFGLYQTALEFLNPIVALVMLGAADVAERYVSRIELEFGTAGLRTWLNRQVIRISLMALGVALLLGVSWPWTSQFVFGKQAPFLILAAIGCVLSLALYQFLAAVLRGLRAYRTSGALELTSAVLLLVFSTVASLTRDAGMLLAAYLASVAIPLVIYGMALVGFLKKLSVPGQVLANANWKSGEVLPYERRVFPRLEGFAGWTFIRLIFVMLFGFLALWGVRILTRRPDDLPDDWQTPASAAGEFALPYRIAQLLGFLAITLWASSYGIAARFWSHGQIRRAKVVFFRVGRLGMAVVTLVAFILLLGRGWLEIGLPAYLDDIEKLLPGLLGMFMWYALVTFFSTLSDLSERPRYGAMMWGVAVAVQIAGIAIGGLGWLGRGDSRVYMLHVSSVGLLAALLLVAPSTVCRPMRFTATGVPLGVLAVAAVTLQSPSWVVTWIAGPVLLGALLFLWISGLLLRKRDLQALRRTPLAGLLGAGNRL